MRHPNFALPIAGAIALIIATGCSEPTSNEPASNEIEAPSLAKEITPLCQLGCTDPDPNPSAPGVFLGEEISLDLCVSGSHTDADGDSLSDFCEKNLAARFAPEMNYYQYDDVRREPRWAARYLSGGTGPRVRIVYLFSYYRDLGSHTFACSVPGPHYACLPHNGDSELVALDVFYNQSTQHWVLGEAIYSQHTSLKSYPKTFKGYPSMEYPAHPGSYPRVYIAEGKHANYDTRQHCNEGGVAGQDTCTRVNTAVRITAPVSQNLGSRGVRWIDCVYSQNPNYEYYNHPNKRTECYWTTKRFRGWVPNTIGGGDAEDYSIRLSRVQF
jgi:hypothetical protein